MMIVNHKLGTEIVLLVIGESEALELLGQSDQGKKNKRFLS